MLRCQAFELIMYSLNVFLSALLILWSAIVRGASVPAAQHLFSNPFPSPSSSISSTSRIPTIHESAVQARRILSLTSIGTLSTVFPSQDAVEPYSGPPASVAGTPIGLMDYITDCPSSKSGAIGDPTILAIDIATSFKNVAAGSNISLSMRWQPPAYKDLPYSAAALPRYSLSGHLEKIPESEVQRLRVAECFTRHHPDAVAWLPGNAIHESEWVRLVVEEVYWIGGFGDRAYIGWIPSEEWKSVTEEEIDRTRLPGECKKAIHWREWLRWAVDRI